MEMADILPEIEQVMLNMLNKKNYVFTVHEYIGYVVDENCTKIVEFNILLIKLMDDLIDIV